MRSREPAFETIEFPQFTRQGANQDPLPSDGHLLTPQQVASQLGVSERWVRDHATRRRPRSRAVKLGPLLRFRPEDIEAFLCQNTLETPSKTQLGGV
jgi:excisionase family DNA binding protein